MFTINEFYSPESISFQNDSFHKELTAIIDKYRTMPDGKSMTEFEIALSDCIKQRTNMNFNVNIGDYPMATEPPHIDKNSPLMEGYGWKDSTLSKQSLSDIRKSASKEVHGLLDPNASYVHGYFATLTPMRMYLNAGMIYGQSGILYKIFDGRQYTSGEISATILHEVGHVWAFFDFLVRFRTTNQILASMVRQLDGTEDHGKREIILKETSDALDLSFVDAQELSRRNNMTIYTVVISNIARQNRTQSGVPGYDINSFESQADQFAARHGASRDLVSGLDKLYKGTIYRRGWVGYFFMEAVKLILLAVGIYDVATGNIFGAWTALASLLSLIMADAHFDWYDKTGYRFKRIRLQLVEELKGQNVSKEDSARIRGDIEFIDGINENFKDHTQLVGLVYDYLIPSGVNARKQIQFQQALEEMASNRLFVYANQIKHI